MALNVLAFLGQMLVTRDLPDGPVAGPVLRFWLVPAESGWWTWLTYAFLHGSPMHLIGNMLFLWVFGPAVEDRLGRVGFAAFYLVGAVATAGAHALFHDNPVVGASGAVACCTGAYLVMFPRASVRVLLFFFLIGVFQLPAWVFIAFAIAKDVLLFGVGAGTVAVEAHLGGYVYGGAIAFALLALGVVPREPYDLFTAWRQARRRERLRGVVKAAGLDNQTPANNRAAPRRRGRERTPEPQDNAATQRARLRSSLRARRPADAATAYGALVELDGGAMPRDELLELANTLYQHGRRDLAATAYARFLDDNPTDEEAPATRLMLARLLRADGKDPQRVRLLLDRALEDLPEGPLRDVAAAERQRLGDG